MLSLILSLYLGGLVILCALCLAGAGMERTKAQFSWDFHTVSFVLLWPISLPVAYFTGRKRGAFK